MTRPSSTLPFPLRLGCVDTGSNAIRFLAVEFTAPGRHTVLDYERVPIRLGHQVFLRGRLDPRTMDATTQAFRSFKERFDSLGITRFRAAATSAVREARNGAQLVERIFRESGIRLEVITGAEEARLVHRAVASRIDLSGGKWVLADLGGGSVEVSLLDDAGMLWSESHTMGSVRLLEELSQAEHEPGRFRQLLDEYVSVLRIPAPAKYWTPSGFIATGGNIDELSNLAAAPEDEGGVRHLPVADLDRLIHLLTRLSYQERIDRLKLREDRADVILPAATVYLRLARETGAETILVPQVGVKEGLILDLMDTLTAEDGGEQIALTQLRQSAVLLGRRFMFDETHGLHVADLSLRLFDLLQELHGLGRRDRQLLMAAAILHDIGLFISFKRHHKHSLYLIHRSELPGLTPTENLIVGNVARYHRKNHPQPHHDDYMKLSPEDRVRVDQLSGILRLADALDSQHRQVVKEIHLEARGLDLDLGLVVEGDFMLERWAVAKKKGLFEETFGYRISIREMTPTE
ncbi:MAG: Ppx/GppA family phosphatase [Gemmatimonadales bacterium]|nr:MAG: Ppx/GppA family phosphatase [Gemmatimonadales bacterium]